MRRFQARFPQPSPKPRPGKPPSYIVGEPHRFVLLDGEMVVDKGVEHDKHGNPFVSGPPGLLGTPVLLEWDEMTCSAVCCLSRAWQVGLLMCGWHGMAACCWLCHALAHVLGVAGAWHISA